MKHACCLHEVTLAKPGRETGAKRCWCYVSKINKPTRPHIHVQRNYQERISCHCVKLREIACPLIRLAALLSRHPLNGVIFPTSKCSALFFIRLIFILFNETGIYRHISLVFKYFFPSVTFMPCRRKEKKSLQSKGSSVSYTQFSVIVCNMR